MPTSLVRITAIGDEILIAANLASAGEFIETDSIVGGSKKIRIQNLKTILGLDRVSNTSDAEKGISPAVAAAISAAALGGLSGFDLGTSTNLPLATGVSGILPVANGGTGVTESTGAGKVVLQTSPTLVTPLLGQPQSGDLINCSGVRLVGGISGILPVANGGTGVTTSTGTGAVVLSVSPVFAGNVGIGTGTPTAMLHVTGNGKFGLAEIGSVGTGFYADSVNLALRATGPGGSTYFQSSAGATTYGTIGPGGLNLVGNLVVGGASTFVNHLNIPANPAANQAVRKDYVDNLVATYSQGIPYPYVNKIKIVNVNTDDAIRVSPCNTPVLEQVASASSIIFYGTYSSTSNVHVAGSSGYVYAGLRSDSGYRRGATISPDPYPRMIALTVTNDGGGTQYFVIRSDGYIEVEFRLGPTSYKRMRWNGNATGWQYGVTMVFSATMAQTSSNALMGADSNFFNPVIYAPSIDFGTYSTPSTFAD
jgi:hypothetical protein